MSPLTVARALVGASMQTCGFRDGTPQVTISLPVHPEQHSRHHQSPSKSPCLNYRVFLWGGGGVKLTFDFVAPRFLASFVVWS